MPRLFTFFLLMLVLPVISYAQDDNALPSATPITASNLDQLRRVAEIEHDWPLDLVWSSNSMYLAVNTLSGIVVHQANDLDAAPLSFPAIAVSPWDGIGSMVFSADSATLVTVNPLDGDLHFWSLTNEEHTIVDISAQDYTGVAAISPDLSMWATAHQDGRISLWDAQTGQRTVLLEGHKWVGAMAISPDGMKLISGGGKAHAASFEPPDSSLRLWDTNTGQLLAIFELNGVLSVFLDPAQKISFSSDGSIAAFTVANMEDGTSVVGFLDVNRMIYAPISIEDRYFKGISFNPDSSILAVGSRSRGGELVLIDTGGRTILAEVPLDEPLLSMAFSPHGTVVAVARGEEGLDRGQID